MEIYKPQTPLTKRGVGFYPLTSADQIIKSNGEKLEIDGNINAEKLGEKNANEYVLKDGNSNIILRNDSDVVDIEIRGDNAFGGICWTNNAGAERSRLWIDNDNLYIRHLNTAHQKALLTGQLQITTDSQNRDCWKLVAIWPVKEWDNYDMVMAYASRHGGTGILNIMICNDTSHPDGSYSYSVMNASGIPSNISNNEGGSWRLYYNATNSAYYLYFRQIDFNTCFIQILATNYFPIVNTITDSTKDYYLEREIPGELKNSV